MKVAKEASTSRREDSDIELVRHDFQINTFQNYATKSPPRVVADTIQERPEARMQDCTHDPLTKTVGSISSTRFISGHADGLLSEKQIFGERQSTLNNIGELRKKTGNIPGDSKCRVAPAIPGKAH